MEENVTHRKHKLQQIESSLTEKHVLTSRRIVIAVSPRQGCQTYTNTYTHV